MKTITRVDGLRTRLVDGDALSMYGYRILAPVSLGPMRLHLPGEPDDRGLIG